jgi:hypothetical protein
MEVTKERHRLPVFRFDKALGLARGGKAFLKNLRSGAAASPEDAERRGQQAGDRESTRRPTSEQERTLKAKRWELAQLRKQYRAAKSGAESIELKRRKKIIKQEIFELESEIRTANEGAESEKPATGALPDFVVIGAQKSGTTFLYHLLAQHPLVQPAASKELHFFDNLFDMGVEWYRRSFPEPRWKGGRRTITGEASPSYLSHPHAARRMAEVVPQARLIALLRNPVDRAYSHYQMAVRRGFESLGFEEAIEAEETRLHGESDRVVDDEFHLGFEYQRFSYLSRGVYVDQLLRWSEFFDKEKMLILKSEDYFEKPQDTLALVEEFLDLPYWVPEAPEPRGERDEDKYDRIKSNRGRYEKEIDPATRRRLEEYFEPHNRRLYDFLGVDFGW